MMKKAKKGLGKGDKAPVGNSSELGLTEASRFDKNAKLRGETSEMSQRPTNNGKNAT